MKTDNRLIRTTFQGLILINILSMLSGIACVMVDSIVTGRFLGTTAFTASGLLNPVVMICNLVGTLLGSGAGIICTRYMGMARADRVNQVFSIVLIVLVTAGCLFTLCLFGAAPAIAQMLGGKAGDPAIVGMIRNYLRGYAFGMMPMFLTMSMMSLMMLDNDQRRGMMATTTTLAADILFDLLNALVFHKGMLGMAVATSLSNVFGLLVMLSHFLRKNRILHFTMKGLKLSDMLEVIACGVSTAITTTCQALKGLFYNSLLLSIAGAGAVASYTVCNSTFSVVASVVVGMVVSSSTLCSLLYGEADRRSLTEGLGLAIRTVLVLLTVVAALIILFARPLAGLFLASTESDQLKLAATFIRFMSLQTWFAAISYPIGGAYQGTGHLKLTYFITILREGVFPILTVAVLGRAMGLAGFEAGLVLSGILVLAVCVLIPTFMNRRFSMTAENILLLPESFGAAPEDTYEVSMHSLEDVMTASGQTMDFARQKGETSRTAMMLSLFVEEMAKNTIEHGFPKGKEGNVDLRLVYDKGGWVLRLRDNGLPFDPVAWLKKNSKEDASSGIGIRMVTGLAKDVRYVPAMQLNNLTIVL